MIKWFTIFSVVIWTALDVIAQSDYTKCEGSIVVNPNASYDLSFKSKKGRDKSGISYYCSLPIRHNNFIYLHYCPLNDGQISMEYHRNEDSLVMFLFEVPASQDCRAIEQKKAQLLACESRCSGDSLMKTFQVYAKRNYYLVLYRDPDKSPAVSLKLNYFPINAEGQKIQDSLMLSLVSNYEQPIYEMHVRNAIDKEPVVSKVVFYASCNMDGTYRGSDILWNNSKKIVASIQMAAEGFYPKDVTQHIISASGQVDTFYLTPITHGSITKLDDIFFVGGLAIILDESLPSLKKLRDFLVLNESVSIEIQGHVNDEGANSLNSKRLSKKRAKKIMEYLIVSGVEPNRLSAIGLGNTQPVYPNPETDEQKEANRRVEIKIK